MSSTTKRLIHSIREMVLPRTMVGMLDDWEHRDLAKYHRDQMIDEPRHDRRTLHRLAAAHHEVAALGKHELVPLTQREHQYLGNHHAAAPDNALADDMLHRKANFYHREFYQYAPAAPDRDAQFD